MKKDTIQINHYNKLQSKLHKDVQKLITKKPYTKLNADEVLIVFGRVYSVYCIEALKTQKLIEVCKND